MSHDRDVRMHRLHALEAGDPIPAREPQIGEDEVDAQSASIFGLVGPRGREHLVVRLRLAEVSAQD